MSIPLAISVVTKKIDVMLAGLVILNHQLYVSKRWTIYDFITNRLKKYASDIRQGQLRIRHYHWVSKGVRHKRPSIVIAIAYHKNQPVGVLTIEWMHCNFYVKPEFRQKGVASQLWNKVSEDFDLSERVLNTGSSKRAAALRLKLGISESYSRLRK